MLVFETLLRMLPPITNSISVDFAYADLLFGI